MRSIHTQGPAARVGCSPVKSLCSAVVPDQQAADGGASLPWGACRVEGGQRPGEGGSGSGPRLPLHPPHIAAAPGRPPHT